jgi:hypothetical protein
LILNVELEEIKLIGLHIFFWRTKRIIDNSKLFCKTTKVADG